MYTCCGPEFGKHHHSIVVSVRALYGLTTSAKRFKTILADFLRVIRFKPNHLDRDVWMIIRDTENGHDYICTHVNDLKLLLKISPCG